MLSVVVQSNQEQKAVQVQHKYLLLTEVQIVLSLRDLLVFSHNKITKEKIIRKNLK